MTNLERALLVAEKAHAGQSYNIYPYIFHVKQVVKIAQELGYDESIVVACALHDVLEDTPVSYNDIRKAFGVEVAEIVYAVTDELGRNRKERKENTYPKIRANWKATVVKICDRIANVRQSKEYNRSLFVMYCEEHNGFVNGLVCVPETNPETHRAWDVLEGLVKQSSANQPF